MEMQITHELPAVLDLFVPGTPGSKGSVKVFPSGGIANDSKKAEAWTAVVALAARTAMAGVSPHDGALGVEIAFYLARPKSHFRANGELKPTAPVFVPTKPDGDKLERCTWDALTGIVFTDDARIVRWGGSKEYAQLGQTGARIVVRRI